jgi:NAD(P)-dependent dehydrogenase (short-subunit alcohol dehydrogenase family)
MSKNVWLITGAGRGMGVEFVKAALAAGHAVVASGRDIDRVSSALGQSNDLLPVRLDVTSRADAEAAVKAAIDRFGLNLTRFRLKSLRGISGSDDYSARSASTG